MGKITRFIGNLAAFASAATGTNRTIFGPKGTATQSDDITDNINPDYLGGWELLGPSDKPTKQQFNALGFTHGQLLAYLHQMGVAEWDGSQEYQIGSIANRAGALYSCKTADHVSVTPPESDAVNWDSAIPADLLNTVRIDVASAATVDLTANAPDTRHINITGSNSISSFTVASGQCYFVTFAGAATLTNSASLVTQRGENITMASGDTCLIRATADNVVEVLCYTDADLRRVVSVGSNANGRWRLWDDGFLEQWGAVVAISGAASVNADFTFPVSYTTQGSIKVVASIGVGVTDLDSSPQYRGNKQSLNIATPTISGCEAQAFLESNTADVRHMSWYSRGY